MAYCSCCCAPSLPPPHLARCVEALPFKPCVQQLVCQHDVVPAVTLPPTQPFFQPVCLLALPLSAYRHIRLAHRHHPSRHSGPLHGTRCAHQPWLTPASWTYTITQDSPWLANLKDGVLDLNLQVMGASRLQYKPWPAFLHLKRGRDISSLVRVMVGDNPTSMGPRVPAVTRVARTERTAAGEQGEGALVALPGGLAQYNCAPRSRTSVGGDRRWQGQGCI